MGIVVHIVQIRLHECACWSGPSLFAYVIRDLFACCPSYEKNKRYNWVGGGGGNLIQSQLGKTRRTVPHVKSIFARQGTVGKQYYKICRIIESHSQVLLFYCKFCRELADLMMGLDEGTNYVHMYLFRRGPNWALIHVLLLASVKELRCRCI